MDDQRCDMDKVDEVMLPGFRFHPTDEELVAFYLKRKIQQKPLSIELIRQLDIYKYDPWDLPKLATTGEKEWYFYCPRDRKYRNSTRPNRVTGAGFWKATGTDRPIYSSEGTKCIGLKKSLVFYRGRAAKGIKTDWMMHEFRLPSLTDASLPKRPLDKNIPPNDSWAICRIFKKTNSMAQRALSQSWPLSPVTTVMPETTESEIYSISHHSMQFGSENISCTTDTGSAIPYGCANAQQQQTTAISYPTLDATTYKLMLNSKPSALPVSTADMPNGFMFSPVDISVPFKGSAVDVTSSMLLNLSPTILGDVEKASGSIDFGLPQQSSTFTLDFPLEINGSFITGEEDTSQTSNISNVTSNQSGTARNITFPFNLPSNISDEWRPNLPWDSPPCPSEMSATYSTNKCYT